GAQAGDRRPAPVIFEGGTKHEWYAASALAVNLADAEHAPGGVSRRRFILADDAAPELRPVRISQLDRDHRAAHQRVVCVRRDFYYPGDEPSVAGHDQGFQRTDAQGPGTSGPIRN